MTVKLKLDLKKKNSQYTYCLAIFLSIHSTGIECLPYNKNADMHKQVDKAVPHCLPLPFFFYTGKSSSVNSTFREELQYSVCISDPIGNAWNYTCVTLQNYI